VAVTIYDAQGRPIDLRALRRVHVDEDKQVAHGRPAGWSASTESVSSVLTPERLARLLKNADGGHLRDYLTLAEEIEERDLHYRSVLGTRRMRMTGIVPAVEPADDSSKEEGIAQEVRDLVWSPRFARLVHGMMDAVSKGLSFVEILWDVSEGQAIPVDFVWRDPRWYRVDPQRLRTLLFDDGTPEGQPLPAGKYIIHDPQLKCGLPIRAGLARPVSIAYVFKSFDLRGLARFLEVYGIPARIGRYPVGASDDDQRRLLRAVKIMGSDAACIVPEDMNVELVQLTGRVGSETFLSVATYWDRQISKAVLGQTSSSEGSAGDYKASAEHSGVRLDIAQHDAQTLQATIIEQLIKLYVDVNHGVRKRYTSVTLNVPKSEDLSRFASAIVQLVDRGLEVDQEQVRERIGLAAPEDGKALLRPAAQRKSDDSDRGSESPPPSDSGDDAR
jgi:phage gp29-like protein